MRYLAPLALLLLGPATAAAVDLVPVTVRPVSVELSVEGNSTDPAVVAVPGTDSASLSNEAFSWPTGGGFTGETTASVAILADSVDVSFAANATACTNSSSCTIFLKADLVFELDVPQIGESTTPIYASIDNLVESPGPWTLLSVGSGELNNQSRSAAFGQAVLWTGGTLGANVVSGDRYVGQKLAPAGDTLTPVFAIGVAVQIPAGQTGSFSDSFTVHFLSVAPTLGNGDVNGDGSTDVADVTILRRTLAGLPVE